MVYEHTDHVMDEQMNFIVHFDWMSFSDGVVPIYSLKSRHGKRQDKKHSHYPSHAGQTPSPRPLGAVAEARWASCPLLPKTLGTCPPKGLVPPASAWLSSGLRAERGCCGLPARKGLPPPTPGWKFIILKGSRHPPSIFPSK